MKGFKTANEESKTAVITQDRTIYNKFKDNDSYADIMPLIDAKLTYLEKYIQLKQDAEQVKNLISKLTTSNNNLIADRKLAEEALEKLHADLDSANSELSNSVTGNAGTFLETLLYYGESGKEDFINKYVTSESIERLESFEEQTEAIEQFIEDYISPITTLTSLWRVK